MFTRKTHPCVAMACAVAALLVLGAGCATKSYVNRGLGETGKRIDTVEAQVEDSQTRIGTLEERADSSEQRTGQAETAIGELQTETRRIAQGKLLFEVTLSTDALRFATDSSVLGAEGKLLLDELASKLKEQNKGIWIEIEGHTDSSGDEEYNQRLGLGRAAAVHDYLAAAHAFPLHKMNVISYGESRPVAENDTRDGRAKNRRVVVRVLE
ncbi:MAG: OmpA family protein [Candidatus Schekmanbacteria bacterium]|nr:OmpA family protein [Candidatus Schekmanbacteria bacterium]